MKQNNTQALRLSFEYFPASSESAKARLFEAVKRHSEFAPEFISMTYGAGGTTQERSLQILRELSGRQNPDSASLDLPPLDLAGHLTIMGASRDEVMDVARQYRELGVRRIVALRGDLPAGTTQFAPKADGFASSIEFVAALKEAGFDVSVGAYPEKHPEAKDGHADLAYLKRKFDAGADRAITQFFFEKDRFLRFRDQAEKAGIDKPIIPGILPIDNFEKMAGFAQACGANVPSWLADAYRHVQGDAARHLLSVSIACDLIENLRAEGVEDVHIYTLNNVDLSADICTALGLYREAPQVKRVA